jgi:hypothetical protein
MPRGSKPGERRGGRKKGTVARKVREKRELAQRLAHQGITPLEVMGEALRYFYGEATKSETPNRGMLMQAVAIAEKMAPYVHPKLSTVTASIDAQVNTMAVVGVPEDAI